MCYLMHVVLHTRFMLPRESSTEIAEFVVMKPEIKADEINDCLHGLSPEEKNQVIDILYTRYNKSAPGQIQILGGSQNIGTNFIVDKSFAREILSDLIEVLQNKLDNESCQKLLKEIVTTFISKM